MLEGANVKLAVVATDVRGTGGRAMLAALLGGEQDPAALADLARGRLRAKLPALRQALTGQVQPHHLLLIERILAHIAQQRAPGGGSGGRGRAAWLPPTAM